MREIIIPVLKAIVLLIELLIEIFSYIITATIARTSISGGYQF